MYPVRHMVHIYTRNRVFLIIATVIDAGLVIKDIKIRQGCVTLIKVVNVRLVFVIYAVIIFLNSR